MYYVPINSNEEIPKRTKGYIMLDREFFEGRYWSIQRRYSKAEALIDLYAYVTYTKEGRFWQDKGKKIRLRRGEDVLSTSFLGKRWKWGRTTVFNFLHKLEEQGKIKQRMEQGENIIFLCDYEDSQNPESYKWNTQRNKLETGLEQNMNQPKKENKFNKENMDNEQCDSSADEPPFFGKEHKSVDCQKEIIVSEGFEKHEKFSLKCCRAYLEVVYEKDMSKTKLKDFIPCHKDINEQETIKFVDFYTKFQVQFIRFSHILKDKPISHLIKCLEKMTSTYPGFFIDLVENELIKECKLTQEEIAALPEVYL